MECTCVFRFDLSISIKRTCFSSSKKSRKGTQTRGRRGRKCPPPPTDVIPTVGYDRLTICFFKNRLLFMYRKVLRDVNKNPTRCNSMQIFIYCKVTLHVSGVTAPIIRSAKTGNAASGTGHITGTATSLQRPDQPTFLVLLMMGAVTPETCRVALQ